MAVRPRPRARNNISLVGSSSSSERDDDIRLSNERNNGIISLSNTDSRSVVEGVAIGNRMGGNAKISNGESSIRLLQSGDIVMGSNGNISNKTIIKRRLNAI